MEYRFDGKRALVTGGSRGIGNAIAKALLDAGAQVYVLGKSEENLEELKKDFPAINTIHADLVNWDTTRIKVNEIGHVHLLVNNAGIATLTTFLNTTREQLEAEIDVNLKGAFNVSQIIARYMIEKKCGGSIVNVSSIYGMKPSRLAIPYSISKAGLDMLTKVMALELGPHQIRVNNVNPTYVRTDMTQHLYSNPDILVDKCKKHPLRKLCQLEDIVNAVLFLLSDKSSMITGSSLPVDGGYLIA